jgi:hypothetical protein
MKSFVCYLPSGEITKSGICQDETFYLQASEGGSIIEAEFKGNQYVQDGALVNMPPKPEGDWYFDYVTKEWAQDISALSAQAIKQRNDLLLASDWTQLPDAPADKQAWAEYRQHLRDVTQQSGFPITIDWGTPPSEE